MLRAHDFDRPDAFRPANGEPVDVTNDEPPPDEYETIDTTELADAPDVPQVDSVARIVAGLGAEIVDERQRG